MVGQLVKKKGMVGQPVKVGLQTVPCSFVMSMVKLHLFRSLSYFSQLHFYPSHHSFYSFSPDLAHFFFCSDHE